VALRLGGKRCCILARMLLLELILRDKRGCP
jgi:hypothetical protein